jgi:hypothetical protein
MSDTFWSNEESAVDRYPQAERCRLSVGRPDVLELSGASKEELARGYPGAVAAIE